MAEERRLVCVPSDDASFVAAVEEAFARLGRGAHSDEELVAAVKAALKARYPGVRLRTRDPIAGYLPDHQVTWYVYRDEGPVLHPDGPADHDRSANGR